MGIFRSSFSKSNTIISDNETNNSQNPVTEISYGTIDSQISRYILDIDLQPLIDRINNGIITQGSIQKHYLKMTNTIRYIPEAIGTTSYTESIERASSFDLELFDINQDWDEGSGYTFYYNDQESLNIIKSAPNWFERKTNQLWDNEGIYVSGQTEIIGTQSFQKGNENLYIDITDYINSRLFSGNTSTYGLGIKFTDDLEALSTNKRRAVSFETNKTNTVNEPYLETIYDSEVLDDRYNFYLENDNNLFLGLNLKPNDTVTVNSVTIKDNEDQLVDTITGSSIYNLGSGLYKISLNLDSTYLDRVLFTDTWNVTINGQEKNFEQEFYTIPAENNSGYIIDNIEFNNYHFSLIGIKYNEKIKREDNIRRIRIDVRNLYNYQDTNKPLDLEYRLFYNTGEKYPTNIIPFTKVNRIAGEYYFDMDVSWLIPQEYKIELRLNDSGIYNSKEYLKFTVVSDEVF